MSLINQMLRDLEQRNSPKPAHQPAIKPRTAHRRSGGKSGWLWLLALIALPLLYIRLQAPAGQTALQSPASVDTAQPIASNHGQAIAISDTPATIETIPMPSASVAPTPMPSPVKPQQAYVQPNNAGERPKPTGTAIKTAPTKNTPAPTLLPTPPAKTVSPNKQAETLYREAQHSASRLMAQENLQEALQLDPHHLPARTLLLQTLLKSHSSSTELAQFVEDSLQLFPGNLLFIKTRAHLYVQQKNFTGAVKVLESLDTDTVDDGDYLALLAAAYQQLQHFPQAAHIYQQLIRLQPDKAENWLGLAIVQDKLNQSQSATQAYRQALDKKSLNAEVVSYIKQRLTVLNSAP